MTSRTQKPEMRPDSLGESAGRNAIAGARPDAFPLLDGLRGLAALGVFVFHGWLIIGYSDLQDWINRVGIEPMRILPNVMSHMGIECVALFYVMSAFLLYRPWIASRKSGEEQPRVGSFALRRAARILPAYWLALVVLGVLGDGSNVFSASGIRDYFFFGQIYHGDGLSWSNPVEPAWTICVEVTFYLFIPLWALAVGRIAKKSRHPIRVELALLTAIALASLLWKLWAVRTSQVHLAHQPLLVSLPASLDVFAAGMGLALLEPYLANLLSSRKARLGMMASALAALFFILLCFLAAREGPFGPDWRAEVMLSSIIKIPIAVLMVIPAVIHPTAGGALRRLYSFGIVCWVGVVSYGLYIWHVALLRWFGELIGRSSEPLVLLPVLLMPVLLASLCLAGLSWYRVERPILRWAHRRS